MSIGKTKKNRRLLYNGLRAQIRTYERCRTRIENIDEEVLCVGMDTFEDGKSLAIWLCTPSRALDGRMPISVVGKKAGNAEVIRVLRAIDYGVYL